MALSKHQRFEIFKRDSFTCQYCGRRPDDGTTILEVDHIYPRAGGGSDDEMNLTTACMECNRGKAAKLLAEIAPKPDADIKTLELQQETAELRRYQTAFLGKQTLLLEVVYGMQQLWCDVSDLDWHPKDRVLLQMLNRYAPEIVESAVRDVAPKVMAGYIPGRTYGAGQAWVKYMWAVMRNMESQASETHTPVDNQE